MSAWMIGALVLVAGAMIPAVAATLRGDVVARVSGLAQLSTVTVAILVVLSVAFGRSDYLIVALALVVVGFAGGLVFVRLLVPRR